MYGLMKEVLELYTNEKSFAHYPQDNYQDVFNLWPVQFQALADTPQDDYYHAEGDVWTHTKMVLDELVCLPHFQQANLDKKFIMFYAALLHDISKPACTKHEDNGKITSAGHSKRGAVDARIMLWKAGVPFTLREAICNIIATHQVPFFAFQDKAKGDKKARTPQFIAHQLSCEMPLDCLISVATADMLGRDYEKKQDCLDDIELFTEIAKEENCYDNPRLFTDDITRVEYFRSNGAIDPNYSFWKQTKSHVFVMCGMPASGKNTWVEKNLGNLPVVSYDDAKEELGLKQSDNNGAAVQLVLAKAKKMLAAGESFVWNATHLSNQMRSKTLDLLYAYDAFVELVYLESPESTIKHRNTKRDTTLTNDKIDTMLFKWELPTPIESHKIQYIINKG